MNARMQLAYGVYSDPRTLSSIIQRVREIERLSVSLRGNVS